MAVTSGVQRLLAAAALCLLASTAFAQPQRGVTDTEIVVGTITDLSGVTAVQGVNNSNAVRLAFDEVNEKGGIHGRKIRYIVEDNQYQVPRAVQAINKLINNDGVFITIEDGGTPMNNATFPMAIEKNVPKLLPLSAARSMFEPFHKLKFSQYSSYVDQMRAGVKYFVEQRGKKTICAMYQDTDFGKDVLAGAHAADRGDGHEDRRHHGAQADRHRLHRRRQQATRGWLRPGDMGTIVRDSTLIIATVKKMGWTVDLLGQVASYDTAIAEAPGSVAEGFYSMAPSLIAYPDDPRPAIKAFTQKYKPRYGVEVNYLGEMGYTSAQIAIEALNRAGRDLTVDSLVKAMESIQDFHDLFGGTYSFSPTNHHGATAAFLSVVHNGRWEPVVDHALAY